MQFFQTSLIPLNRKLPEMIEKKTAQPPILRVGTLFSGIGAFEQALKQMKIPHEIIFACDNGERYLPLTHKELKRQTKGMSREEAEEHVDGLYERTGKANHVMASYFANYAITLERWHNDVRFMDGTKYKDQVDILVGGSPCQSFSTYGLKLGLEDARGTLFYEYARMIKEVQPKVFIFENVKGLTVHDKGHTWEVIQEVFDSLDYDIAKPEILNACDYGLPQMRKRLFVVGVKRSLGKKPFKYPQKIKLTAKATDYLTPSDQVPIEYYLPKKGYEWTTEVNRSKNKARINRDVIGCQTAVQQFNWSGDFRMEVAKPEHRLSTNKVFVTQYKGPNESLQKEFEGKDVVVRKLMPEECLRLMGFEDFNIVVEPNVAYRQAGNSIAVPVLKALVKEIMKQFFNREV